MTSTPPANLSEREMLVRAIHADPADDTPRLVYADFLDAQPTRYVKCSRCKGRGKRKVCTAFMFGCEELGKECDCGSYTIEQCDLCPGSGEIPDDTDARQAELIRIQVGLPRLKHPKTHYHYNGRKDCDGCKFERWSKREPILTAALRDRLLPRCPECGGQGHHGTTERGPGLPACPLCDSSGRCPGTFERGLPVVTVPLAVLGEEKETCKVCWEHRREVSYLGQLRYCARCDVNVGRSDLSHTRIRIVWHPSDFARACVQAGVGMRLIDREPGEANHDGYQWLNNPPWSEDDQRDGLPTSLFLMLEGARYEDEFMKWYPAAAAVRALEVVMWRVTVAGA